MKFLFDKHRYVIDVQTDDMELIDHLNTVYDTIKTSSLIYIMIAFFKEFESKKFTGTVLTTWNGYDVVRFSYKNGKFHTNNRNHAAIKSHTVKIFMQDGKLRTREFGPYASVNLINETKWHDRFYTDEDQSYGVNDLLSPTQYVSGSSSHLEDTIYQLDRHYKPKYGAKYIKRGKSSNFYDFGSPSLSLVVTKYMKDHDLKYDDISKQDWEIILFQCNIMVK
jgi:hypothetical protein